jgi:hypothetical protein
MSTILNDQAQALENAINQSMAAAGSALTHPVMLAIFALVFGPPLLFCAYKLIEFIGKDEFGLSVFWDWGSSTRKK